MSQTILDTNFTQNYLQNSFQDYIIPAYTAAVNTVIKNRALVLDTANTLQALPPVERVMFRGLNQLATEFGPAGQQVWELESKDTRFRFWGGGWNQVSNAIGNYASSSVLGDMFEAVYYGTGITLAWYSDASARDYRLTIDNNAEGASNVFVVRSSNIEGRQLITNVHTTMVSGQPLGWHSIKIRLVTTDIKLFGAQILNESTALKVTPGQVFIKDKKDALAALSTIPYDAGLGVSRGGRVIAYLQNGAVTQVKTQVPASALYMTSTDHTNEEPIRKIFWRELGFNRGDDFSMLSTIRSSLAHLDDNSTTLITNSGTAVSVSGHDAFYNTGSGNYTNFGFTGTGLDITMIAHNGASGTTPNYIIKIDGVTVYTGVFTLDGTLKNISIASGLAYCWHTVQILCSTGGGSTSNAAFKEFIPYQPKAPAIPSSSFKICDYNVPATYAMCTEGIDNVSSGVIRVQNMREFAYVGTWAAPVVNVGSTVSGMTMQTTTLNSYVEYSFFGTTFDYRVNSEANQTQTISVDGSSNFSGFTTNLSHAGATWTAATGTLTGNGGVAGVLSISGLSMGWHRVRITLTVAGGGGLYIEALDIAPPIHMNHPTFKIGGNCLTNNTKIQPSVAQLVADPTKVKASLVFDTTTNKILYGNNISQVLPGSAGWLVYFIKPFKSNLYVMNGSCNKPATVVEYGLYFTSQQYSERTPGRVWVYTIDYNGGSQAPTHLDLSFCGELFDE